VRDWCAVIVLWTRDHVVSWRAHRHDYHVLAYLRCTVVYVIKETRKGQNTLRSDRCTLYYIPTPPCPSSCNGLFYPFLQSQPRLQSFSCLRRRRRVEMEGTRFNKTSIGEGREKGRGWWAHEWLPLSDVRDGRITNLICAAVARPTSCCCVLVEPALAGQLRALYYWEKESGKQQPVRLTSLVSARWLLWRSCVFTLSLLPIGRPRLVATHLSSRPTIMHL